MFCFLMGCQDDFIFKFTLTEPDRQIHGDEMDVPAVDDGIVVTQRRGFAFLRHLPPLVARLREEDDDQIF